MTGGPSELHGTIEPDGDHVWNGFGMIEDLAGSLESQIGDWRIVLIHND